MKHTQAELRQKQSLPLAAKIRMSQNRIRQWYEYWDGMVYVAFSGGKDSLVLLHLVRSIYPEVPGVFCDTGLEYPEIREFVKTFENVVWLKPKMGFQEVIKVYGYPVVSKKVAIMVRALSNPTEGNRASRNLYLTGKTQSGKVSCSWKLPKKWHRLIKAPFKCSGRCCNVMKKDPSKLYEREFKRACILGMMASDSEQRQVSWMATGCNNFGGAKSVPMAFWLEKDVWEYLRTEDVPYCKIYDMGYARTGCMFCMFGVHMGRPPNRFQRMQQTHPKQWKFCMENLGIRKVMEYIGVPCEWLGPGGMPLVRKGKDPHGLMW